MYRTKGTYLYRGFVVHFDTFRFFRHLDPLSFSKEFNILHKHRFNLTLELCCISHICTHHWQNLPLTWSRCVYSFSLVLILLPRSPTSRIKKKREKHIFTASYYSHTNKLPTVMMNTSIRDAAGEKISVELASLIEIKPALLGCSFGVNRHALQMKRRIGPFRCRWSTTRYQHRVNLAFKSFSTIPVTAFSCFCHFVVVLRFRLSNHAKLFYLFLGLLVSVQ